jgi:hypothetical protein
MKRISNFFASGFLSCTGHSLATHFYYYEGKPQIGYVLRQHYVILWLPGYRILGTYVTQLEAQESAKELGITL